MIKRLNIKHYNTILTEKLQKDQQYHQAKYKYKYLKNEEVLTSSQSHITQILFKAWKNIWQTDNSN